MGLFFYAIHKHSCMSRDLSVLNSYSFMFRQVCTIEPSFFQTTSGMHRRLFEGRHLVNYGYLFIRLTPLLPHMKSIVKIL